MQEFLWGSSENQNKTHLISWERICKPKDQGGLGFRNFRELNKAYMMKLAWQLMNNPEKLWVQIMKAKYNCGPLGMPSVNVRNNASIVWKAIV